MIVSAQVTSLVMKGIFVNTRTATSAVLLLAAAPAPLLAYLDPGSGSYMLQMLVAGLFGASVGIKTFWKQIKGFFTRGNSRTE
jgi:hypothetical protein